MVRSFVCSFVRLSIRSSFVRVNKIKCEYSIIPGINISTGLAAVIELATIHHIVPVPYSELLSNCRPQRSGKLVKNQLCGVNSNSIQLISIIPAKRTFGVVGDQKSGVIRVSYDSQQILVGMFFSHTTPIGRWEVVGTPHGALFVYKFKRNDEPVFFNFKSPVSVTSCSKTDRIVIDLLPVTWK